MGFAPAFVPDASLRCSRAELEKDMATLAEATRFGCQSRNTAYTTSDLDCGRDFLTKFMKDMRSVASHMCYGSAGVTDDCRQMLLDPHTSPKYITDTYGIDTWRRVDFTSEPAPVPPRESIKATLNEAALLVNEGKIVTSRLGFPLPIMGEFAPRSGSRANLLAGAALAEKQVRTIIRHEWK